MSDVRLFFLSISRSYFSFAESFCIAAVALAWPVTGAAGQSSDELEEIVVTASLRPAAIGEFPSSVTVLDHAVLAAAGLQHLQDVLGLVPNLNWSGGQFGRGANDAAETVSIQFNAEPDYTELRDREKVSDPLYPELREGRGGPKDQYAYKHHPVWIDHDIDNTIPSDITSPHSDKLVYHTSLNRAYRRGQLPYQIAERITVMGITGDDILMKEGTSKDGIVKGSGKYTMPILGTETLNAGDLWYWDLPDASPDRVFDGGCSTMEHVPDGYLTLWMQPYHPDLHRCTPIGLAVALEHPDYQRELSPKFGQHLNATRLLEVTMGSALTLLGTLREMDGGAFAQNFENSVGAKFDAGLKFIVEAVRDPAKPPPVTRSTSGANFSSRPLRMSPVSCSRR